MMSLYCIDNNRRLLVFSTKIRTDLDMRALNLMVDGFTDVMQQSGTLGHTNIHTNLTGKQP